jgi:HAD superfamily hydrolase (TIGR01490 family)
VKRFAVFDIDGTLFRWQLFSEIIFELIEGGHIPKEARAAIDKKMDAWRKRTHRHSFHEFEMATVDAFVAHINTVKPRDVEAAADTVLSRSGEHVYTYTRDLITKLQKEGYTLIAISGSQDEIVQRFAKLWKFDIALGQARTIKNDSYIGDVPLHELVVMRKGELLQEIVTRYGLTWKESYAVGDSKSDAAMLSLVENPIAFNPNDELFEIAKREGWKVVVERKNMSYELERRDGTYILATATAR